MHPGSEIDRDGIEATAKLSPLDTRDPAPTVELADGIPVWKHGPGAVEVTSEMVRNVAEDQ